MSTRARLSAAALALLCSPALAGSADRRMMQCAVQ